MRVQSFLIGIALSCHAVVGGGAFLRGVKPLRLDIRCGVDRPGPQWTGSFMEKPAFSRAWLSIYCGDYVCPRGGATMSLSDGTDSNT
jgi:hypothetical protein